MLKTNILSLVLIAGASSVHMDNTASGIEEPEFSSLRTVVYDGLPLRQLTSLEINDMERATVANETWVPLEGMQIIDLELGTELQLSNSSLAKRGGDNRAVMYGRNGCEGVEYLSVAHFGCDLACFNVKTGEGYGFGSAWLWQQVPIFYKPTAQIYHQLDCEGSRVGIGISEAAGSSCSDVSFQIRSFRVYQNCRT